MAQINLSHEVSIANNIQCPACHHPNGPAAFVCKVCDTPIIKVGMTVTLLPQIDIAAANHIEASEALTIAPNASFSDNSNSTEDAMADFRIIDVLGQRGMIHCQSRS